MCVYYKELGLQRQAVSSRYREKLSLKYKVVTDEDIQCQPPAFTHVRNVPMHKV